MDNRRIRATSNLAKLEIVARKLEELNNEVVYVGGCTTALFINDPLSLDVRPTQDVDCIVDIVSSRDYTKFGKELSKKGFRQSIHEAVICRWFHDENIILDVMPTNEKILGFGNRWYKEALENPLSHQIADNLVIKSITPPYFLATKIEAFKTRGHNDFWSSHDLEDIITLIAGRVEIADEVESADSDLRRHLQISFSEMMEDDQFELSLPGHVSDGPATVTMQRVQKVKERIERIINRG
jgi:hypothetical protein